MIFVVGAQKRSTIFFSCATLLRGCGVRWFKSGIFILLFQVLWERCLFCGWTWRLRTNLSRRCGNLFSLLWYGHFEKAGMIFFLVAKSFNWSRSCFLLNFELGAGLIYGRIISCITQQRLSDALIAFMFWVLNISFYIFSANVLFLAIAMIKIIVIIIIEVKVEVGQTQAGLKAG